MDFSSKNIEWWLSYIGLPATVGFFLALFIFLVWNIDKLEAIGATFARLFAAKSKAAERKYISLDIQAKIDKFAISSKKELGQLTQPGVKIEWLDIQTLDQEAYFKEGTLILRMSSFRSQEENVARATLAYVQRTVLYLARNYLHISVDKGINYSLANRILKGDTSATQYLFGEVIRPEILKDDALQRRLEQISDIDERGYLGRILVLELRTFEDLFPDTPRTVHYEESLRFLDFLFQTSSGGGPGHELDFIGNRIKTSIVLVARKGMATAGEIARYTGAANVGILKGARTIHFCAWGKDNVTFAKTVIEAFKRDNRVYFKDSQQYDRIGDNGKKFPAIWGLFRTIV